jgi:hypothetical protein
MVTGRQWSMVNERQQAHIVRPYGLSTVLLMSHWPSAILAISH